MKQIDFWSENPCGGDGDLQQVVDQRNRMEPWLPAELRCIPVGLGKYLEVGCGQGVDGIYICSQLDASDSYTAIDYSSTSVNLAIKHLDEAKNIFDLKTTPNFFSGDALNLEFKNEEFDYIYSMGVIHHTPNPQKAIDEVFRVLKPGGQVKIFLYRRNSLKVGIAKLLRLLQLFGDKILSRERFIYNIITHKKSDIFGSMFLECFGVPWMNWYSEKELQAMFQDFKSIKVQPYGLNFPGICKKTVDGYNRFGYFFKIEATK